MEWIIAIVVFFGFMALLPGFVRHNRKSRRKGMAGGIMMGLGLAFMTIFDTGKAESVEEIRTRKDLGDADQGESGEGVD